MTAPRRIRRARSDLFFVLAGELTFFIGPEREERVLPAGTLAFAPPFLVHGFRDGGDAELRYLNFHRPAAASPTTCAASTRFDSVRRRRTAAGR